MFPAYQKTTVLLGHAITTVEISRSYQNKLYEDSQLFPIKEAESGGAHSQAELKMFQPSQ
jgi:hypothetical protein